MNIEEIKRFPLAFDGKNCIGPNVRDVVYLWTENDVPCYVGYTKQGILSRIQQHLCKTKRNITMFQNKLRSRYSDFRCYILYHNGCDELLLKSKEVSLIDMENTYYYKNPNGYNLTVGGEGRCGVYVLSEDGRKRIIDAIHRRPKKVITEKQRQYLRMVNLGRKHSDESKKKRSKSIKLHYRLKRENDFSLLLIDLFCIYGIRVESIFG